MQVTSYFMHASNFIVLLRSFSNNDIISRNKICIPFCFNGGSIGWILFNPEVIHCLQRCS